MTSKRRNMPRKYSRRRPSSEQKARTKKKKSMRRRSKSKKMRGGVTVRAQDLKTRLPEVTVSEVHWRCETVKFTKKLVSYAVLFRTSRFFILSSDRSASGAGLMDLQAYPNGHE